MQARPVGITALTLALEFLTIGFGLAGVTGLAAASELPTSIALFFLLQAGMSGLVAVGLHRMRWWSLRATRLWSASAVALFLLFFLGPEHGLPVPLFAAFPFGSGLFGFCWILEVYVPYAFDSAA